MAGRGAQRGISGPLEEAARGGVADAGACRRDLRRLGGADVLPRRIAGMARHRARRMADSLALLPAARDRPLPSDALAARQRHARLRAAIVVAALCAVPHDASCPPSRRGLDRPARRPGILLPYADAMAAARSAETGADLGADDA